VRVVATAGHVDHGKSTLLRYLTGTDPDRLAEERRRGLTIDLGFVSATLPSGAEVGFVDVPGHVRFVKNMLAGVGAVDACLFVVAATEGWMPQSEEHLRILELLGISHGVIALTKVGLVDDEWLELAEMELAEHVAGTFLEQAPVVRVDAPKGIGLEGPGGIVEALEGLVAATPAAVDRGRPRLWVDRSFALSGPGTVVTGTLTGGTVILEDRLAVLPGRAIARVRALESHGRRLESASPGRRLAINLAGVAHHDIRRGQALVRPGQWFASSVFDASLQVLASLDHDVTRRGAYTIHLGSGEHLARLSLLGGRKLIEPGDMGLVRLRLPVALPLLPGDRYVLRETGRSQTVGGGVVLDIAPVRSVSRAAPTGSVDQVIAERGFVDVDELERLTGERRNPELSHWVVDPFALEAEATALRAQVHAAGPNGLDVALLDERRRAVLATLDDLVIEAGRVLPADQADVGQRLRSHPFLAALEEAPFSPPPPDGVDRVELRLLVRHGLVVDCGGILFAASALERAGRIVASLLADQPEGVTASAIREALGTSRKFALPLLAGLDAAGVTRRRGDLRVAGPRLPAPEATAS
jgi:selenocysteine-specific elongation factor